MNFILIFTELYSLGCHAIQLILSDFYNSIEQVVKLFNDFELHRFFYLELVVDSSLLKSEKQSIKLIEKIPYIKSITVYNFKIDIFDEIRFVSTDLANLKQRCGSFSKENFIINHKM